MTVIDETIANLEWVQSVGLIIGSVTPTKTQLVHLAPTKSEKDETIVTLRSSLLSHHSRQVVRMLPGGLDVVGLYYMDQQQDTALKTLQNLQRQLTKLHPNYSCKPATLLLHIDAGNKMTLKSLQNDKLVNTAFSVGPTRFIKTTTDFDLTGLTVVSQSSGGSAVASFIDKIGSVLEGCVVLFDGGGATDVDEFKEECEVSILVYKLPISEKSGGDFVGHLKTQGLIKATAYLPTPATTAQAKAALLSDILRSTTTRIEMHLESLIDEEEEVTTRVYHEIPRRVFVPLKCGSVSVSDYLFPGEGPTDSVTTFQDILSLSVNVDSISIGENPFDPDDLQRTVSMDSLLDKEINIKIDSPFWRVWVIVGIVILAVGVVMVQRLL